MTDYILHGTTLTLVWFAVVNVASAGAVAWLARRVAHVESPSFWFMLRMLPAISAALFAIAVFVPSYSQYEPLESSEGFSVTLTLCASAALAMCLAAAMRAMRAWSRAAARVTMWMQSAQPLGLMRGAMPAYVVDADAPVMALAGVLRPRLLVSRSLVHAFTHEELAASLAHEVEHRRSWDNLKRLVMCGAPDALRIVPAGRFIEQRWALAAEHAADRMDGDDSAAARCALASALVKVARLRSLQPTAGEPISTLIGGGEIASRVERLLDDTPAVERSRRWWPAAVAVMVAAASMAASYGPILRAVHAVTEMLVRMVP